ncbi:MAG: methyltransferase [Planctomycetes bacterium]|nr:methyltransferase [Planctomycetota bacterium]
MNRKPPNVTMEQPQQRHSDNLYPVTFAEQFGDHLLELDVPAGVWNPTPHGVHLAEMLLRLDFARMHVLELGTGCGIHAILLAKQNAARLTLTEIDPAINDNARHNLEKHGIDVAIEYLVADWTHLDAGPFDAVVANPPFAKAITRYRRYFIDTLILDAHKLVRPGGWLVFVQSSMANIPRSIRLMQENGMGVRIVGETDGPFRDYYFEDEEFMREIALIPGAYTIRDGVYHERLIVFQAMLPGAKS